MSVLKFTPVILKEMELEIKYKNFNTDKSIDELLFKIENQQSYLKSLEIEIRFLKFLIEAKIFKTQVMNLFETLTIYDRNLDDKLIKINDLLQLLSDNSKLIAKKIECEDLECDAFFINSYDILDFKYFRIINDTNIFKAELFQYLKSVIKNA